MAIEEGKLPVGPTDQSLDTTVIEQSDGAEAHREVVVLADPETREAYVKVAKPDGQYSYYSLRTHDPQIEQLIGLMSDLLQVQRAQFSLMREAFEGLDSEENINVTD